MNAFMRVVMQRLRMLWFFEIVHDMRFVNRCQIQCLTFEMI